MKIKINDREYDLNFISTIGVYYTYESEFGTSFYEDSLTMSELKVSIRLVWAIIKTDNASVDCTFDNLLTTIPDETWEEVFTWIKQRMKALRPAVEKVTEAEEDKSKNA